MKNPRKRYYPAGHYKNPLDKMINLSQLPPTQKSLVWNGLKRNHPDLSDLLQSDLIKQLREEYDGEIFISQQDFILANKA